MARKRRRRIRFVTRAGLVRIAIISVLLTFGVLFMISMPGRSYRGVFEPLSREEESLKADLRSHVFKLAGEIGARGVEFPSGLDAARVYIEETLALSGYTVQHQTFETQGVVCHNLEVEIPGAVKPDEIIIVGGHYDSVLSCPAANDNATGTAAVLQLARLFAGARTRRTLRLVCFVNEEPPFFQTADMGSWVYAKRCRERGEKVVAMLSLETMGYYSDDEGSQRYPPVFGWFYPSKGNFIGFVGNLSSRSLVRRVVGSFRRHKKFPSEGGALPAFIPGVGWSDHWAFWQEGYAAVMVTDTAPFRYPYYHSLEDTPEKVDYARLARVVAGLERVIAELVGDER